MRNDFGPTSQLDPVEARMVEGCRRGLTYARRLEILKAGYKLCFGVELNRSRTRLREDQFALARLSAACSASKAAEDALHAADNRA